MQRYLKVFIDLDNTLNQYSEYLEEHRDESNPYPQSNFDFYRNIPPNLSRIQNLTGVKKALRDKIQLYFLTASSPLNPMSFTEKAVWCDGHLDQLGGSSRLLIVPDKSLIDGHVLIDDGEDHGQLWFTGTLFKDTELDDARCLYDKLIAMWVELNDQD